MGRMTALQKPTGGVRGIVAGDIIRRLVLRTMVQQIRKKVAKATAPFQHSLSTRAGCECIVHAIQAMTDANPHFLSVDGIGAYDTLSRKAMLSGLVRHMEGGDCAFPYVLQFHGSPSSYLWEDSKGVVREVLDHLPKTPPQRPPLPEDHPPPKRGWGHRSGGPEVEVPKWGAQNFTLFFLLSRSIFFFFLLRSSRVLVVFGVSGCRVKSRRPQVLVQFWSPPPTHHRRTTDAPPTHHRRTTDASKNPKRAHLSAPAFQTPPKFHEKDTQKRERKNEMVAGERKKKKREILGPQPTLRAPTLRATPPGTGPVFQGPTMPSPTRPPPPPTTVMPAFGQTAFGQNRIWPKKSEIGQFVFATAFGQAAFGQN